MTLTVAAMQWSALPDIDAVDPIGVQDTDCLLEIRDVLRKHRKQDRFGVFLAHSHFALGNGEILLETTDQNSRTLTTRAVKEAEAGDNKIATMLLLGDENALTMSWCRAYCARNIFFGHDRAHHYEK